MKENCQSGLKDYATDLALHSYNTVRPMMDSLKTGSMQRLKSCFFILLPCQSWHFKQDVFSPNQSK